MIKNLNGMLETPDYRQNTHICLYKNDLKENYPPHWHFPFEILMPIENTYTIIANNETYVVKPYELLFISSGVIHSSIAPAAGVRYFLQVDVSRLKSITGVSHILSFMGPIALFNEETAPDIHKQLSDLFLEICDEYFSSEEFRIPPSMKVENDTTVSKGSLCEPIIYGKLLTMLTLIGRSHLDRMDTETVSNIKCKEYIGKFMGICHYIDEHFAEDLNLDDVASMAGFSKFHFSRLFKQFTNLSFYKYVNQQRISYAEELLANPDLSVTQIAIQSGFSSSSSFIRMFKQIKNCTPTDFRNIHEQLSFQHGNPIPETIQQEQSKRY